MTVPDQQLSSQYNPADIKHDRDLIEKLFQTSYLLTPDDMKKQFGKYG